MGDYPKVLYRAGNGEGHQLWGEQLLIDGKYSADVLTVNSEDEELSAMAEGWRETAEPAATDEPRRGRPPKIDE